MDNWQAMLLEETAKLIADPTRPYNLHFYECKYNGRLRIFDLFRTHIDDEDAVTIGESLTPSMEPIAPLFSPPVNAVLYTHVNYGGVVTSSPDWFMGTFAGMHKLTDVVKLMETTAFNQVLPVMQIVIERLYREYAQ